MVGIPNLEELYRRNRTLLSHRHQGVSNYRGGSGRLVVVVAVVICLVVLIGIFAPRSRTPSPGVFPSHVNAGPPPEMSSPRTPSAPATPCVDCKKARLVVEVLICNDAELASLDWRMADEYRAVRERMSPERR